MRVFALLVASAFLWSCPGAEPAPGGAPHPSLNYQFKEREPEIATLYKLGLRQNPVHIADFLAALASKNSAVREAAMAQLLFTNDATAVQPVIAVMKDESRLVRRLAIATLERMGAKEAIPSLKEALTHIPPPAPRGWDSQPPPMEWEEHLNRLAAALALHRLGDDAGKPVILDVLKTGTEKPVITMAINIATLIGMKEALPECIRIAKECQAFGEDSPGMFAMRAIRTIGDGNASLADVVTPLAIEKYETPGGFSKFEALAVIAHCGDRRGLDLARRALADPESSEESLYVAIDVIEKFKPEDAAPLIVKHKLGTERYWCLLSVLRAAEAVARLGDKSVIPDLKKAYAAYGGEAKEDHFVFRLNVAWVLAELGEEAGFTHLYAALKHEDAAVRRLAAQLLERLESATLRDLLSQALKTETEPSAFRAIHASLKRAGGSPEVLAIAAPPAPTPPVDTYDKPRYVHFNFDDCATIESMERFADLVESLAKLNIRWVFTMNYAPLSRHDHEYCTVLVQRLFDRGCSIQNHTLRHNPDGRSLWASTDDQLRSEFSACNSWLRSNIMGLDRIYGWAIPGGGFSRPGDPERSWRDIRKIMGEAMFDTDIRIRLPNTVEAFTSDLYAPPYHIAKIVTRPADDKNPAPVQEAVGLISYFEGADLKHGFNFMPEDGIRAYAESFDYWYFHQPTKIFRMSGHDWPNGPIPFRPGHVNHWDILSGFINEVLVERRGRYGKAICVTELELAHIFNLKAKLEDLLGRASHLQSR